MELAVSLAKRGNLPGAEELVTWAAFDNFVLLSEVFEVYKLHVLTFKVADVLLTEEYLTRGFIITCLLSQSVVVVLKASQLCHLE